MILSPSLNIYFLLIQVSEPKKYNNSENVTNMKQAVSQPLLANYDAAQEKTVRDPTRSESGTMYRPDALYQGSLSNISQHRSIRDSITDVTRYGSLRRNHSPVNREEEVRNI